MSARAFRKLATMTWLMMAACAPSAPATKVPTTPGVAPPAAADAEESNDPKRAGFTRVLSLGAEPREKLRYHFTVGQHEDALMSMALRMTMPLGHGPAREMKLPKITSAIALDVEGVTPAGDAVVKLRMGSLEVVAVDGEETPEAVTKAMFAAAKELEGLVGHQTISPRGLSKDISFEMPANLTPTIAETIEGMRKQCEQMAAPFPEEGVGIGARWERVTPTTSKSIHLTQTATYELLGRTQTSAALALTLKQEAAPQSLDLPNLPPGASVRLEAFAGSGTGKLDLQLGSLAATSSLQQTTKMDTVAETPDAKTPMTMTFVTEISVRPGVLKRAARRH